MSEENSDTGGEVNVSPEVIKEAEVLGWVPKEKFRGNEDDWIDADVFVKRGKEINPILRKNNEILFQKLSAKDAEIAQIRADVEEFKKYHNETEERVYKRALADLKAAKKEAMEEQDHDSVIEIDEQIADLKDSKKTVTSVEPERVVSTIDPVYSQWEIENQWVVNDTDLAKAAEKAAEFLRIRGDSSVGRTFLEKVTAKVKEAYPEKFGNINRDRPALIENGGGGSRPSGSKTYSNLPAEAKAACDRFVKQGMMTKEEYLKEYDWN